MKKTCHDCGREFYVSERDAWKITCFPCWKGEESAKRRVVQLEAELIHVKQFVERLMRDRPAAVEMDSTRVRQLIQLTHPDKHGGSSLACDVTRWLLQQKKAITAVRSNSTGAAA